MIKVAILGIESSHAWDFVEKLAGTTQTAMFEDVEIIGVYVDKNAEDAEIGSREIKKRVSEMYFAKSYDEFVEKADAVMITTRYGDVHLKYARPYLEKGIPVWVDKPICWNVEDTEELVRLAEAYQTPVCGGSCLVFSPEIQALKNLVQEKQKNVRGGHVTAPLVMPKAYGGFWFYSPHLIQMLIEIFGQEVKSVSARRNGEVVQAVYHYEHFDVSAFFGTDYTAAVYCGDREAESFRVSMEGCQEAELLQFCNMVKCKSKVIDYEKYFLFPVRLIDATIKAFEEEKEIEL